MSGSGDGPVGELVARDSASQAHLGCRAGGARRELAPEPGSSRLVAAEPGWALLSEGPQPFLEVPGLRGLLLEGRL